MNKTELMENYTAEQLAEMVVSKQNIIDDMKSNIDFLNSCLERGENTINQIDEILKHFFGATFEICETKEDFEVYRKFLEKQIKLAAISDFLPTEPIKVADLLINAEGEYERNPIVKKICGTDKGTYRIFDVSELRQIAEHLLVYCNHNGETEE